MAGLLDGLEQFGLGNLKDANLFEQDNKITENKVKEEVVIKEEDFLFDKTHVCPVCDKEIKAKTVKNGKAKLLGSDMDLRATYEGIDMLKYDVIVCQHCGYAALTRYFKGVLNSQVKLIRETITSNFKGIQESGATITYAEGLERYQLVLANAIVKKAKASEKAYICLKAGWLCRGYAESLDKTDADYSVKSKELEEAENEYLRNAMEGFITARQSESFPLCGMDTVTIDYLIAVMAVRFGKYSVASKLISSIITMRGVNPRMKDRAIELKDILLKKYKEE